MSKDQTAAPIHFNPRRLGHANLWVGDVERNTAYYNCVFGLELVATEPGVLASFLGNGNTHHDIGTVEITRGEDRLGRDGQILVPKELGKEPGLFHLGWEMENESDLVAAIRRLQQTDQAIAFFADHKISHSIYVPDPDGNLHEFYADALIDWRTIFQGEMELLTGVWNPGKVSPTTDARYDPNPKIQSVRDAPLHPLFIEHVALVVGDLGKSADWFTTVAGLHVIHRADEQGYIRLAGALGQRDLSLFQAAPGQKPGLHHISFRIAQESELAQSKARLETQGIPVEKEVDNPSKKSIFLRDPDGVRWEFFVRRQPDHADTMGASVEDRPYFS